MIIGFLGMGECGKTTACKILCKYLYEQNKTPKIISFAGPLKRAAAREAGYGNDWEKFKAEKPKEYRDYCTKIGAERRAEDPQHWVKQWIQEVNDVMDASRTAKYPVVVLVDDVRYPNEVDTIRLSSGTLLYVDAGDRLPNPTDKYREHESEKLATDISNTIKSAGLTHKNIDPALYYINNRGTLAELETRMKNVISMPDDVVLSSTNPWLMAYWLDIKIKRSDLAKEFIDELKNSEIPNEIVRHYIDSK